MSPTESPAPRTGAESTDLSASQPPLRTFDAGDRARASLPSREQLLSLADRAELGALTPPHVHQLKAGIVHLAAQLGAAGERIRRLTADLAAAEAQRVAVLLGAGSPLAVGCSFCEAPVGVSCRSLTGEESPRTPHTARLDAVRRAAERLPAGGASCRS